MCEPATIMLAATLGSSVLAAKGAYDQGQVQKQVGRNNQIMAEYAAVDAIRRGDQQAAEVNRRAALTKGSARANLAARGVDLGAGTAGEIQEQIDFFAEGDQNTARFNAQRDAWAARASGQASRAQGDAAARQGNLAAFSTLLASGGQVADKWGSFAKPKMSTTNGHGAWT